MKKIFLTAGMFLLGITASAQNTEQTTTTTNVTTTTSESKGEELIKKNDIVINPIALVLGAGNISYERHINRNSSVGIQTFFSFVKNYDVNSEGYWYLLPDYRYYLGKKPNHGFFLEGFTGIVSINQDVYEYSIDYYQNNINYYTKRETNFAFGVGFGGKWRAKNIIFETSLGIGRAFGNDDFPVFAKGMLGLGYRF